MSCICRTKLRQGKLQKQLQFSKESQLVAEALLIAYAALDDANDPNTQLRNRRVEIFVFPPKQT